MLRLLAFIPEPWGSLVLVAVVFGAWAYGDITGRGSARQAAEIERLEASVQRAKEDRDASLAVQLGMAERLSELRAVNVERETTTNDLIAKIRKAGNRCHVSDDIRVQLLRIRIGPPRVPGSRQSSTGTMP